MASAFLLCSYSFMAPQLPFPPLSGFSHLAPLLPASAAGLFALPVPASNLCLSTNLLLPRNIRGKSTISLAITLFSDYYYVCACAYIHAQIILIQPAESSTNILAGLLSLLLLFVYIISKLKTHIYSFFLTLGRWKMHSKYTYLTTCLFSIKEWPLNK